MPNNYIHMKLPKLTSNREGNLCEDTQKQPDRDKKNSLSFQQLEGFLGMLLGSQEHASKNQAVSNTGNSSRRRMWNWTSVVGEDIQVMATV